MPRNKQEVEKSLLRKGFLSKDGDHNFFIYHSLQGKKTTIRTKTSHSPKTKDLTDILLGLMAKQCGLTKVDFLDLVDCPMTRDRYEEKLVAAGLVAAQVESSDKAALAGKQPHAPTKPSGKK